MVASAGHGGDSGAVSDSSLTTGDNGGTGGGGGEGGNRRQGTALQVMVVSAAPAVTAGR